MKILRSLQVKCVNLGVASEKATGNGRRKSNALSSARKQGVVAGIEHHATENLAFNERTFLRLNKLRGVRIHVKDVDVLQRIAQATVGVSVNWFAHLECEAVITLVILGTQVVRFGVKGLTSKRKASVEEIWFGNRKNKILTLGAVLETQP